MRKISRLYIGTSGWVYPDWLGIFYPKDLPSKDRLKYFSQHFKTAEVNYSFYRLPRPAIYQKWYSETPEDFLFSVKASRFITHTCLAGRQVKRLKGAKGAWEQFLENALNLKEKLGPILFQFPSSFKASQENIKKLDEFLKFACLKWQIKHPCLKWQIKHLRFAFEFRHRSWCDPEGKPPASYGVNEKIYNLLKKYNIAWVVADSPRYPYIETLKKFRSAYGSRARLYRGRLAKDENRPKAETVTADFVYIRLHGSKILFVSKYTKKELSSLAQKIKKWLKQNLDVFVYFNNDFHGYAIENAKDLMRLTGLTNEI